MDDINVDAPEGMTYAEWEASNVSGSGVQGRSCSCSCNMRPAARAVQLQQNAACSRKLACLLRGPDSLSTQRSPLPGVRPGRPLLPHANPSPLPAPPCHPARALQATQQVQIPAWLQKVLRLPGGAIIVALILFPLTLVGSKVVQRDAAGCSREVPQSVLFAQVHGTVAGCQALHPPSLPARGPPSVPAPAMNP